MSQVVDELDLIESYVFVLLLDFDRLGQVKVDLLLLGDFLRRLELCSQLVDFLLVSELEVLSRHGLSKLLAKVPS